MPDTNENEFVYVGDFPVHDAKRVIERFEAEHIEFEIEADDTEIQTMSVLQARRGGTFGLGAKIHLFVPKGSESAARKVIADLFPL
jgi:hypothetical protein